MNVRYTFDGVNREREELALRPSPPESAEVHAAQSYAAQTVMDPRVYKIAIAGWVTLLGVFWITFWSSASALFMVTISTVYAIMFFGVPYMMTRQIPNPPKPARSFATFLSSPFATIDETMPGWEALLQVILVPVCLVVGGIAIGIIISVTRASF
jgi:hypothetical protein